MDQTERAVERLRRRIAEGDRDAFDDAVDWFADNLPRPGIPPTSERSPGYGRERGPADFSTRRCRRCRTRYAGDACGFCRRNPGYRP